MADTTVSTDIDAFMGSADNAAARASLELGATDTVEFGAFIPPAGTTAEIDAVTTADIGQVMIDTDRNRQVRFTGAATYIDIDPLTFSNTVYVAKNGTDTRTGLSANDVNIPFLTVEAAYNAATEGDTIMVMPGDFSSTSFFVTKDIIFYTSAGSLIPSVSLATAGKRVEFLGFGSVNGFLLCEGDGDMLCAINVLGGVTLKDDSTLIVRDCYIEANNPAGAVKITDQFASPTFEMRNCRVKCTGTNGAAIDVTFLVGTGTYIVENSILEANGTGASIDCSAAGPTFDIINVAANTAVNANTAQSISTILVDPAVRA